MVNKFYQKYQKDISFFLIVLAILLLDQLTKYFAKSTAVNKTIIPKVFSLTYIQNTGAGFGLFQGFNLVFIFISLVVIIGILYYYKKIPKKNNLFYYSAAFILAGAIGNLIDRIFHSFVIDFINFQIWPAFNFADLFITVGVIGLVIHFWKKK